MGHAYVSPLFRGNEGVHGEQSMLVDSGGTYSFLPLSVIEKTGAVRTSWKVKIRPGDRSYNGGGNCLVEDYIGVMSGLWSYMQKEIETN
jgi:hypothetical protein